MQNATRRRPRISILTALLLIAIIAMAIVIAQLWTEVDPLRREVRKLRQEAGYLSIDGRSMLHAIAIETTERDHFRWRVFIPETPTFYLHDLPFDVPKTDIPQYVEYRGGKPLRPGEHIFDMRIKPALGRDDAVIALMSDRSDEGYGGTEVLIEERKVDWINTKYSPQRIENYYRGVSLTQMTVSPEEPLVLIRMRACRVEITERKPDGKPSSWHFEAIEEPTDGLMMWINQYENEKDVPMHLRNSP